MLKLKKWQLALLVLTTFIFIIEIISLVNIIRDSYKLELLNVSDWVGSISTFCTLIIALIAFTKAPDWIKQKHYEVAHQVVEEAVYGDLETIGKLSRDYRTHFINVNNIIRHKLNNENYVLTGLDANLELLLDSFDKLFDLSRSIQNKFLSVKRIGYELTPYSDEVVGELTYTVQHYEGLNGCLESLIAYTLNPNMYEEATKGVIKDIDNYQVAVKAINKRLHTFIDKIRNDNENINSFFKVTSPN